MAKRTGALPSEELALFCDQVAMVLLAGVPLGDAMETLAANYAGTPQGERFSAVSDAVAQHGTLYDAMQKTDLFPPYLTSMVRVGELAGRLDEVMRGLALYYRRDAQIKASVKSAITYPTVLVLMMGAAIAVLIVSVLPVFTRIFASLGSDLGTSVSATVGVTVGKIVLIVIGVLILLLIIIGVLYKTKCRGALMRLLARVFSPVRKVEDALFASRFAQVMAMMLKSGCDLDEAMDMAVSVPAAAERTQKAESCRERMRTGAGFYEAVSGAGIFEPLHCKLIATGDKSGKLDQVLENLGEQYSDLADDRLSHLVSAIEPTLVALLCVAIGGILLSVMLPLLGVLSTMA